MSSRDRIYIQLCAIIGSKYVSYGLKEVGSKYESYGTSGVFVYQGDHLSCSTGIGKCDFVVLPRSTEEVQEILRLANREKIPVVPMVANSCGGMATPLQGGIVLDLRRMNKVEEINEDDMYALVQGGITWGDLEAYLQKNHPNFRLGFPYATAAAGVVPCYLEYGFVNLSMIGGSGAEFINGLEVVLPNGEIALTGTAAYAPKNWSGRVVGPDLTGLFVGYAGRTGIVTKAAIKLWPKLPRSDWYMSTENYKKGIEIAKRLYKAGGPTLGIVDLGTENYVALMAGAGVSGMDLKKVPYEAEKVGIPDFYGSISMEAYTEREMEAKAGVIHSIIEDAGGHITLTEDAFKATPLENRGEGPTYIGTLVQQYYMWYFYFGGIGEYLTALLPINRIAEYYEKTRKVAMEFGKHILFFHRAMFGGHYNGAGILIESNKDDPEDMKRTRKCLIEMDKIRRKLDGVVHKPNYLRARRAVKTANPTSMKIIQQIKKMLDPNGILNPGQGI